MSKVVLQWSELRSELYDESDIFEALLQTYEEYSENSRLNDIDDIIEWLQENLDNYLEDFLHNVDFMLDINGDIDIENITGYLKDKKFIESFKKYYDE